MLARMHRDLTVWQRSMQAAAEEFRLVERLPPSERFELGCR
jgi:hypothetical protein